MLGRSLKRLKKDWKMEYSKQEINEIEDLKKKYPVVEKLWVEHELNSEDVAKYLLFEMKETSKVLAQDLKLVRTGSASKCKIIGTDYFDSVSEFLIKGDKIFSVLQKGKEVVNPEGAAKDKKVSDEENEEVF